MTKNTFVIAIPVEKLKDEKKLFEEVYGNYKQSQIGYTNGTIIYIKKVIHGKKRIIRCKYYRIARDS